MDQKLQQTQQNKSEGLFFCIEIDSIKKGHIFKSIPPREYVTLLLLTAYSNKGLISYPTILTCARLSGVCEKTIQTTINSLVKRDYQGNKVLIKTKFRPKGSKYFRNQYKINPNLGISIFKSREKKSIGKNIEGNNLPIKNTHPNKKNQSNKEIPVVLSFNKKREVGNPTISTVQELLAKRVVEENQFMKVGKVATALSQYNLKYSYKKAYHYIQIHLEKLGEENWNSLYEQFLSLGIQFYSKVTYKVLQEGIDFAEAIKLLEEEIK